MDIEGKRGCENVLRDCTPLHVSVQARCGIRYENFVGGRKASCIEIGFELSPDSKLRLHQSKTVSLMTTFFAGFIQAVALLISLRIGYNGAIAISGR